MLKSSDPHIAERGERIKALKKLIYSHFESYGSPLSVNKIISEYCIYHASVKESKAIEYLRLLDAPSSWMLVEHDYTKPKATGKIVFPQTHSAFKQTNSDPKQQTIQTTTAKVTTKQSNINKKGSES